MWQLLGNWTKKQSVFASSSSEAVGRLGKDVRNSHLLPRVIYKWLCSMLYICIMFIFNFADIEGILLKEIGLTSVKNMSHEEKFRHLCPEILMFCCSVFVYFTCRKLTTQGRDLTSQSLISSRRYHLVFCKYKPRDLLSSWHMVILGKIPENGGEGIDFCDNLRWSRKLYLPNVCVFQRQPTALLRASGSTQGG